MAAKLAELRARVTKSRNPNERIRLQRQVDSIDGQIDKAVYELYGLTEKEIALVEEATGG